MAISRAEIIILFGRKIELYVQSARDIRGLSDDKFAFCIVEVVYWDLKIERSWPFTNTS